MRRSRTLRALAAGAGAAAVLTAAAGPALAQDNPPFDDSWREALVEQGYADVRCSATPLPGNQDAVFFEESGSRGWGGALRDGNDWLTVVLKVGESEESRPWSGYGDTNVYEHSVDGTISHVMLCQGTEAAAEEPADEPVEEPEPTEEPGDEPSDEPEPAEDATDDADAPADDDDDAADEDAADPDEPTGPPVETDGRSQSGPDVALLGGAALVLAGAGAAGFAMRRRGGAAR